MLLPQVELVECHGVIFGAGEDCMSILTRLCRRAPGLINTLA